MQNSSVTTNHCSLAVKQAEVAVENCTKIQLLNNSEQTPAL